MVNLTIFTQVIICISLYDPMYVIDSQMLPLHRLMLMALVLGVCVFLAGSILSTFIDYYINVIIIIYSILHKCHNLNFHTQFNCNQFKGHYFLLLHLIFLDFKFDYITHFIL